jgi:hypothetical protein
MKIGKRERSSWSLKQRRDSQKSHQWHWSKGVGAVAVEPSPENVGGSGRKRARRSVDAEHELHSLDDARSSVLRGLVRAAFAIYSALMNEIGGSVALEVRCFEELDSTG